MVGGMTPYSALREARHDTVKLRGLDVHLTRWGPEPSQSAPPIFLLHGWLDSGETFQFMVDSLKADWPLVAPDWRGFGRSEWPQQGYWFPDYLADLDALLDLLSPAAPARLVGHSMGGNIACSYAGVRPERVRCVVNLEGVGLARTLPAQAPGRIVKWLEQLKSPAAPKEYASIDELTGIIQLRYPRFSPPQAAFIARAWGKLEEGGRVRLAADPRHQWINPVLYKREDTEACWREMRAPLLMLMGAESDALARLGPDGTAEAFRTVFPRLEIASVAGAGHMLHIEKPDAVAALVESFLEANCGGA